MAGAENLEWKTTEREDPRNFSSLLQKEHIHVYRPPAEEKNSDNVLQKLGIKNAVNFIVSLSGVRRSLPLRQWHVADDINISGTSSPT